MKFYFLMVSISSMYKLTYTSTWPHMKNYDIWGVQPQTKSIERNLVQQQQDTIIVNETDYRNGRVLNFFPVPVEEECVTEDGRRSGVCLNVYDCHRQGGTSKGQCALGFGACCVFTVSCDQEIKNNITYIISPGFPAIMQSNITNCKLKIKMISPDVSQLRFDFIHFSLGQPNRANGICDGDLFTVNGGSSSVFKLCGQNNGQHMYYDILNGKAKDNDNAIDIIMNFSNNSFASRLWEIKVSQIPFSQRAPANCLQYFTGENGIIQTFNFAENGRHLANQEYRVCIRQELKMCSIAYEPCNRNSFKIGPIFNPGGGNYPGIGNVLPVNAINTLSGPMQSINNPSNLNSVINPNQPGQQLQQMQQLQQIQQMQQLQQPLQQPQLTNIADPDNAVGANPIQDDASSSATNTDPVANDSANDPVNDAAPADDDPNAVEGSGENRDEDEDFSFLAFFTRRSMRSRERRQYFAVCADRITMPCIVEDFLATKASIATNCIPVHCGGSLCPFGAQSTACRVESTVTPFGIGVHFGDGINKGSPEDNIGMCLRYSQMNCI